MANIKTEFSNLSKNKYFKTTLEKLTLNKDLDNNELSYVLSLSIVFYDWYKQTQEEYYLEFSYYLTLKYSLNTLDIRPLYDFSINNGLYPITKLILSKYMTNLNIFDVIFNIGLDQYKFDDRIELKKQIEVKKEVLDSKNQYKSFIAPTSYGKSELIKNDIVKNNYDKIGIIVPKKALIWENFRRFKITAKEKNYKIMMHDSEYNEEKRFIGIFTQERAIRLIQDNAVYFDVLYIDEAHNIFEKDERNILLLRLIRLNRKYNPNHNVLYLSPLIRDSNNLIVEKDIDVDEFKITFNIKVPDIYYYDEKNIVWKYNRFINDFLKDSYYEMNWVNYIKEKSTNKTLLYLNRPKHVQEFALFLSKQLPNIEDEKINELIQILKKYVHEDYYLVELIRKGIIYIHGKMPDSIRDYLTDKYKNIDSIKYLVSNTSVLEGVNFPIDSLFIFNGYGLTKNDLNNLIGRVNRLNQIFIEHKDLNKLITPVHFVYTKKFTGNTNLQNKIRLLRTLEPIDYISNPILPNSKNYDEKLVGTENLIIEKNELDNLEIILLKNGINFVYTDFSVAVEKIRNNLLSYSKETNKVDMRNIINLIEDIFIKGFVYCDFGDLEVARLVQKPAINFYKNYYPHHYFSDLKNKINYFMRAFAQQEEPLYYIGESFGEVPYYSVLYPAPQRKVYVNIKNKTKKELINLAVIKSKIEDDFISFKLTKFVKTLYDLKIINKEDYDEFLYNTRDSEQLKLLKSGLSISAIKFIKESNLESDFKITDIGVITTEKFNDILEAQDDYIKFEFNKIL